MERALLVSVDLTDPDYRDSWPQGQSAQELAQLVRSCGVGIIDEIAVHRDRPSPTYFLGRGKAQELHDLCHRSDADLVIFGEDLSASQQRNLEELIGAKIIDRTQLILDIFAQRAKSQEGKVQVELAQLEYLLPRLAGKGTLLSRLGGGIGTRGPGEQKLEMDRRRIRLRIARLHRELGQIHRRRGIGRRKREEQMPAVALIGYTNVGKSTLLNALTRAGAPAEDRLFTTLDPLSRRLTLPNHQPVLLVDTVGFLHRLPHHLIEAFQATLEELTQAQLLLHLVDASHPQWEEQAAAVRQVLETLHAEMKPVILLFNKVDQIDPRTRQALQRSHPEAVFISAETGEGLPTLLDRLAQSLSYLTRSATVRLAARDQSWLERIYAQGDVLGRRQVSDTIVLKVRVPHRLYGQLEKAGLIKESFSS